MSTYASFAYFFSNKIYNVQKLIKVVVPFQKSLNYGNSISVNNIEQMLDIVFEEGDILNEDENEGVSEPEP
jgi:hypothetical protein